jgi:UTP--glucose-1-phosphate uridylyltransferase
VLRARKHVGDEPFAVRLGDDLIDERDELLTPMIEPCQKRSASIIALMEVPAKSISM